MNKRQPKKKWIKDNNKKKWKATSKMEDNLKKMEDNFKKSTLIGFDIIVN